MDSHKNEGWKVIIKEELFITFSQFNSNKNKNEKQKKA